MATRTWRGTLTNAWGTAGNWLEGAVPTNLDDVVFDATSLACNTGVAVRTALTLNFSTYTNTMTIAAGARIDVSGNLTLGAAMTLTQSNGGIAIIDNSTITTNGIQINVIFVCATATKTYTFADNVTFARSVDFRATSSIINFNGSVNILPTSGTSFLFGGNNQTINLGGSFTLNRAFSSTNGFASAPITIKSNVIGVKRSFTLPQGNSQDLDFVNFTDIDASNGVTLWPYKGVVTNCDNIFTMPTQRSTVSISKT
jgi:hypothetical protein